MPYSFPPDVAKFIEEQMKAGGYASEDDVLRDALRALAGIRQMVVVDDPESLVGIQRGLDEMNRGLGRPFEDFHVELMTKGKVRPDG